MILKSLFLIHKKCATNLLESSWTPHTYDAREVLKLSLSTQTPIKWHYKALGGGAWGRGRKMYLWQVEKFSHAHNNRPCFVRWKQTGQVYMRSIQCLFVVLVVWLTCLAPVTLPELRSVTLFAGIVNPAGVSDSNYFMPELGSVRLISAWQPTWDVELRSVEQLIAD